MNDQRGQAQRARGQWTEILFFAIFRTFAMDTTLLRLIFIQNVKKGKNQPTLLRVCLFEFGGAIFRGVRSGGDEYAFPHQGDDVLPARGERVRP